MPAIEPEFSYILTGYSVSMFTVNSCTGQFTAATPASVSTGYSSTVSTGPLSTELASEQMVADPLGRFAYVANLVSNVSNLSTISMYTINSATGVLTPTSPATIPTGWLPQGIAIDPLGRFVYTANSDDNSISMFTINQTTGVLTPTSPASVPALSPSELYSSPSFLTVDPTGKFLYLTLSETNGAVVSMFTINQTTGLLTPNSPASIPTGGTPFQVQVAPNGKFAYVANNLAGNDTTDGVWEYTVNPATGVLTAAPSIAIPAGAGPTAVAIDPTSRFAYVVNRLDNTVSMFTIDPTTGNLALNATAANPKGTVATGTQPFRIDFDPSGKFVYVTNEGGISAFIYAVNSDGTLTKTGTTGVSAGSLSTAFASVTR